MNWRSWLKWIGVGADIAAPIVAAKKPVVGKMVQIGADVTKDIAHLPPPPYKSVAPPRRMSESNSLDSKFWERTEANARYVDALPSWKKGSPVNNRRAAEDAEENK